MIFSINAPKTTAPIRLSVKRCEKTCLKIVIQKSID
uniref:Uncharacterized protein n=1 Tax=Anguilla anguilla TaxID=7936 RepID=A0A0E9U3X8_ANGAN